MTHDLHRELELARRLAREAGRLILDVYATDFAVVEKAGDQGPVTEADRRANAHIVDALRREFPADGIVAEESKDNSDARQFARCWFIDPLDGTREFVARNGEFAVHVGLAVGGEARLGVVYQPVTDKLYAGIVGEGCELEEKGARRSLRVRSVSDPAAMTLVVSRSHKSRRSALIREKAGIGNVRECGSVGLKCGLLAEGVADVYLHPSPKSSRWDSCAPEAVLRAAGGTLTDFEGARYRYDGTELVNVRGLFGCTPAAHDVVWRAIESVLSESR